MHTGVNHSNGFPHYSSNRMYLPICKCQATLNTWAVTFVLIVRHAVLRQRRKF